MSIDWTRNHAPISKLNLANFSDFVETYTEFTYGLAYRATGSEKLAEEITKKTLARVILRESVADDSDEVYPETGIRRAIVNFLSAEQIEKMDSGEYVSPPRPEVCDRISDDCYDIAEKKVPRYAPTFSGTTGSIVIIGIVACIIAAILLVWLAPNMSGSKANDSSDSAAIAADAAGAINSDFMLDLNSTVMPRNAEGKEFNSGVMPVILSISGPDIHNIAGVDIHNDAVHAALYQCGKNEYCYFAQSGSTYEANVQSVDGSSVSSYAYIPEVDRTQDVASVAPDACIAIAHSGSGELNFMRDVVVTKAPEKCDCVMIGGNSIGLTPNGKESSIGIDSITVKLADGEEEIVVPIIIYNNEPKVDKSNLRQSILHTPCHSGNSAGYLSAKDEDGDDVTFELTSADGCVAILAPSGSYMVHIDDDFSEEQASFCFTVSDGRITSDEYTVLLDLENNLISTTEFSQDFVCYSGEDGFYTMKLPAVDDDGDKLKWELISASEKGVTPNGSTIRFEQDGSVVKYRIDPTVNRDFTEALEFTCTDGWLTSPTITFTCRISQNNPPRSGGNNFVTMQAASGQIVCTVHVADDCEFDKQVITGWKNAVGGSVVDGTGWDNLQFTFVPDGSIYECTVDIIVADKLTGATGTITYTIIVE